MDRLTILDNMNYLVESTNNHTNIFLNEERIGSRIELLYLMSVSLHTFLNFIPLFDSNDQDVVISLNEQNRKRHFYLRTVLILTRPEAEEYTSMIFRRLIRRKQKLYEEATKIVKQLSPPEGFSQTYYTDYFALTKKDN